MHLPGSFSFLVAAVARAPLAALVLVASFLLPSISRAQEWFADDVGSVGVHGAFTENDGIIGVRGSGADIWGTADAFFFRHRAAAGDTALVARITHITNNHAWTKAGLMMRPDLARGSPNVMVLATPGNHIGLQFRSVVGGNTTWIDGGWTAFPVWVRLDRVGDSFRAFKSYDGDDWTPIGSATVVLPDAVRAGIAITSHNNANLAEATLDNYMQIGDPAPAAPSHLGSSWTGPNAVQFTWRDNSHDETAFEIERAIGDAPTFSPLVTVPANTWYYADNGLTEGTTYRYRVRAVGESNVSAYSNIYSVTTTGSPPATPAAPTNLRATSATTTSIALAWNDNSGDETGFELWRAPHGPNSPALLATLASNTTSYNDTGLTPGTAYDYYVRAVRNGVYSEFDDTVESTNPLWTGHWTSADVGAVGSAGSTNTSPDEKTFTLNAGGGDIWGTADAFRTHYVRWSGDTSITARVTGLTHTDPWAKAGVMIRETLASNSANTAMVLTAGNVSGFQARAAAGAATEFTGGPWVQPVYWVRLTRTGNEFKGYVSPDGTNWTLVGTRTVTMGADVLVGVVASAHSNSGAKTTAVFDHVSLPAEPFTYGWNPAFWGSTTYGGENYYSQDGTTVGVAARSGDIWGTSDAGIWQYREWTGNVTIMARVSDFQPASDWTKAGIMIRASGAANAANVFVAITGGHGNMFQSRTATGAQTTSPQRWGAPGPKPWFKLVRQGDTFHGYASIDNRATWTLLGSATIAMPAKVQFGFALSSRNTAVVSSAEFAEIKVE